MEIAAGSFRYNWTDLFDFIVCSVEIAVLEEGGLKGTDPKETVEAMLASTFPLVGQR